ncbi:MAG: aminotransferase class V-fold PLP-dependent enzyme [Alphaproteobacteria bacterium]|nr:aminotransferase class V-fold PLP-dependent enzyme [Alphaproteobacteria bacterium]
MIPCQRHLFDIPTDVAYLNCAYMSPLLKSVCTAGHAGLERKAHPWQIKPAHFFEDSEVARALFARLIGASAEDIALVPAASYGISIAALNLAVGPDRRVVILADQFPSNVYPWRELVREKGGEVLTVARPADQDWTAALLAAIDERAAIVALPHCHWTDGGIVDLVAVGARCRAVRAALVLDLTQSLGALPFDVAAVRPDYITCATYKWLLGPYSMGFLYVAPPHREGKPLEHGWIDRAGSENFAALVNYRDGFQPGARRYDVGERSNFALLPMVIAALRQIEAWGVPAIAETLAERTAAIAHRATGLGLSSVPGHLRAGHFLGLRFRGGVPDGLPERLAQKQVYVSVRGGSMRVTPHLWVNDADIDKLFAVLEPALDR